MNSAPARSLSKDPKRVFLSYAHPDEERVRRIYADLQKAGFHPWMDRMDLPPGADWREEIDRAIRSSAAFLSLISKASLDRGGILSGEMKLALDLRAERLDSGGLLIPVRLEPCDLPKQLDHIQALDWFESGGEAKLVEALASGLEPEPSGRPWRAITIAALALLFCLAVSLVVYRASGRSPSSNRPATPDNASPADQPFTLGVTLWRLATPAAGANSPCADLKFEKQSLARPIRVSDRIRFDVRPSRPGYLYIITSELDGRGRRGAPLLLFPISSFDNHVASGGALLIPPASEGVCNMLHITHLGEAEEISLLFSADRVSQLGPGAQPYAVSDAITSGLEKSAALSTAAIASTDEPGAQYVTLPDSESRDLGYTDSGPGSVFPFPSPTGKNNRFLAKFVLKTGP